MDRVDGHGKKRVGEGTEVKLSIDAEKFNCYVNDDGKVTMIEKAK